MNLIEAAIIIGFVGGMLYECPELHKFWIDHNNNIAKTE